MKIVIVIPNWNGADLIAAALWSLQKQSHEADVVVVDNGSVDGSVGLIESSFPDITLIKLPKNHGFAGGVNVGIRYALENNYDAVALFNNDAVADTDWLKHLVRAMASDPGAGIVSCKQLRMDKKHIDSTGDLYSIWGLPFPRGRNHPDEGQYDRAEEIFSAPAGATLYRVKLLEDIGLFDERFFAYYEDVDISFRARLAGWKALYEPAARVYHHISATSTKLGSFSRYHTTKNYLMTFVKNMPGLLFWKYLPLVLILTVLLGARSVVRGDFSAYLRGIGRFVLYLPGILASRWRIQRTRRVSSRAIDKLLYRSRPPKIPAL